MDKSFNSAYRIGIIGLGYVGLPLALAFGKQYPVIGFDIKKQRVAELQAGADQNGELSPEQIKAAAGLVFSANAEDLRACNIFIITVPTPLTPDKQPDLQFLISASEIAGKMLKKDDIVIYESTVYPGCTEEDCVPVLARVSGLVYNKDFFCGYSPERINPGDKSRDITQIKKVTSGSTEAVAQLVDGLYASVITAGTHLAPSIKVAEAAKAIENAQRDVNISFMNEIALIFDKMGIDTGDVLEAAATKWNFLPFKPGLVGGHCIGVDPHYLAYKASQLGYEPQVILSGRKVNERMGVFVAEKMLGLLSKKYGEDIRGRKVLILGFAFKENCGDTRNTKVADIYHELQNAGLEVSICDPNVDPLLVKQEYGITVLPGPTVEMDAVLIAVAHDQFSSIPFHDWKKKGIIIFDAKNLTGKEIADGRL
jgi:UDP-N-acetyl-D-galactosamine dehydrogenase